MLNELRTINSQVYTHLVNKVAARVVNNLPVGTKDLGSMDFIKEDHGPIRIAPKVFTVSALSDEYADASLVAQRLIENIEDAASHVPGQRIIHISNPYLDYKPGALHINYKISLDLAIYSYDGTTLHSVTQDRYGESVRYVPEVSTHISLVRSPYKLRTYPENVLSEYMVRGASFFNELLATFDTHVAAERAKLETMQLAAITRERVQNEINAGNMHSAALMLQEFLGTPVMSAGSMTGTSWDGMPMPTFIMNNLCYHPDPMLDVVLIQGGFFGQMKADALKSTPVVDEPEPESEISKPVMPGDSRAGRAYARAEHHLATGDHMSFIKEVARYFNRAITIVGHNEKVEGYRMLGKVRQATELLDMIYGNWLVAKDAYSPSDITIELAHALVEILPQLEARLKHQDLHEAQNLAQDHLQMTVTCSPDLMTGHVVFVVDNQYRLPVIELRKLFNDRQ